MDKSLKKLREFAYSEAEKTEMPIKMSIELVTAKGIELAKRLNANAKIVEAGTLMMDCVLGRAVKADRINDHIYMCHKKTKEILENFDDISPSDKENIMQCVLQHHGCDKFYSLESEICCNADCYKFASTKGFIISIRYLKNKPFDELISLLSVKADEKWKALTLDICKEEIKPQYDSIQNTLYYLNAK